MYVNLHVSSQAYGIQSCGLNQRWLTCGLQAACSSLPGVIRLLHSYPWTTLKFLMLLSRHSNNHLLKRVSGACLLMCMILACSAWRMGVVCTVLLLYYIFVWDQGESVCCPDPYVNSRSWLEIQEGLARVRLPIITASCPTNRTHLALLSSSLQNLWSYEVPVSRGVHTTGTHSTRTVCLLSREYWSTWEQTQTVYDSVCLEADWKT